MAQKSRPRPSAVRDDITRRVLEVVDSGRVTQAELARRAGISQSAVSMGITGYRPFNRIDVLDALHDVLPSIERRKA